MEDKQNNITEDKEVDLLALANKIWVNKKFIIKCCIVGVLIGIVIAFSIPKEYTTTVVLTTGTGESAKGNMGTLASIAGINLGSTGTEDVFSPELYPDVLNSTPFVQGLLNIDVVDKNQDINTSLYKYLKDKQISAWWNYILQAPGAIVDILSSKEASIDNNKVSSNARLIPEEEMNIIESIKSSYLITTDKKTGLTTIDVTSQSPKISAFLADTITSYLQSYIIEQRTQKAKKDLSNSEKLYEQARTEYYKSQQSLASFADANMNVISAKYRINQEKLQNEASIAYSVYNQMAQQVQMNKIKVQDNTPVFTIIQPAIEPLYPEKPKRKIIVFALGFLSVIVSCGWVIRKDLFSLLLTSK